MNRHSFSDDCTSLYLTYPQLQPLYLDILVFLQPRNTHSTVSLTYSRCDSGWGESGGLGNNPSRISPCRCTGGSSPPTLGRTLPPHGPPETCVEACPSLAVILRAWQPALLQQETLARVALIRRRNKPHFPPRAPEAVAVLLQDVRIPRDASTGWTAADSFGKPVEATAIPA